MENYKQIFRYFHGQKTRKNCVLFILLYEFSLFLKLGFQYDRENVASLHDTMQEVKTIFNFLIICINESNIIEFVKFSSHKMISITNYTLILSIIHYYLCEKYYNFFYILYNFSGDLYDSGNLLQMVELFILFLLCIKSEK